MGFMQYFQRPEPNPDHVPESDFFAELRWGQVEIGVAKMFGLPKVAYRWRDDVAEPVFSRRAIDAWVSQVRAFFPDFRLGPRPAPRGVSPQIPTASTFLPAADILEILGWDSVQLAEAQSNFSFPATLLRSRDPWSRPEAFLRAHEVASWAELALELVPNAFQATASAAVTA